MIRTCFFHSFISLLFSSALFAAVYYVSPNGNDVYGGTLPQYDDAKKNGPFKTLKRAASILSAGDTLMLREGIYRETLSLNRSGMPSRPVIISNFNGETPVISGADLLGRWDRESGTIYSTAMDIDLRDQNQIFLNGSMQTEARWPNAAPDKLLQPERAIVAAGGTNTITDPALPGDADDYSNAYVWFAGGSAWYFWTANVTAYDAQNKTLTIDPASFPRDAWYYPRKGNSYIIMGARKLLDTEGEWWYDRSRKRLFFCFPSGASPETLAVEAKRRELAISISAASNIRIEGLMFRSGGLVIDNNSKDITLSGLTGKYLGHSYISNVNASGSVVNRGNNVTIVNCEFAYSSGSILTLYGNDCKVVNNYLHDANYAGRGSGAVTLAGRKQVFSYNTVHDAGRDIIYMSGLSESIVEHNDLARAGWLTHDLGMIYGHSTDFQNTVFRFNTIHDSMDKKGGIGIYFDHASMNMIIHNNALWNIKNDPIRFNNPSYYALAFHNTAFNCGNTTTFDHSKRNDLFGSRFINNLYDGQIKLPAHVVAASNLITDAPGFVDAQNAQFALKEGSPAIDAGIRITGVNDAYQGALPDSGAYEYGKPAWISGHDRSRIAEIPAWLPADIMFMNVVRNSCFEYGLEQWRKTGAGSVKIVSGNGWGNGGGRGAAVPTATGKGELELSGGKCGADQLITGLIPNTQHTLSGWVRTSSPAESVAIGIRNSDGIEIRVETNSTDWVRLSVEFTSGSLDSGTMISVAKTSGGPGFVRVDNLGLPKKPAESPWERPAAELKMNARKAAIPEPSLVKRVSQPPLIDGALSPGEWTDAGLRIEQSTSRYLLDSPACTARVCHDGAALYVSVTVPLKDSAALRRGTNWGKYDGVELCFIDAKGAAATASYVVHGFADGASESLATGGVSADAAKKIGDVLRFAASVESGSWTGEWAIPFSDAEISPSPGMRIPFNICVYRSESNEWMLWVGSLGPAYNLENGGMLLLE